METMYFIFGVLSVIALIVVGAVVYSIVRIFKQEKQIKDIQKDVHWNFNDMSDRFKDVHQRIEDYYVSAKDMSNTYTDMRIDKLENKLTGQLGAKQLIKG
jgi:hypothetical protein